MEYRLSYSKEPTAIVYLSLDGDDLIPDEISEALDVVPDKSWRKGDRRKPKRPGGSALPGHIYTFGHWDLNAPCSPDEEAEAQIAQLLTVLEGLPAALRTYVQRFKGTIVVAFSSGEVNFGFYLSADLIRRLGALGLAVVFDIYPIPSDDEQELEG